MCPRFGSPGSLWLRNAGTICGSCITADYYWRDEAIPRLAGLVDRELAWKSDLYTDQEMRTSAAYNEFRVANKTQNGLFTAIYGLDGSVIVWSCGNSTEREGWGHDQIRIIGLLAPHLRQAARVRRALADARALGASLAGLLENGQLGLLQLDRRGRIMEANDRARDVLLERNKRGPTLHGENSTKFNSDCTICRPRHARSTDPTVPE